MCINTSLWDNMYQYNNKMKIPIHTEKVPILNLTQPKSQLVILKSFLDTITRFIGAKLTRFMQAITRSAC